MSVLSFIDNNRKLVLGLSATYMPANSKQHISTLHCSWNKYNIMSTKATSIDRNKIYSFLWIYFNYKKKSFTFNYFNSNFLIYVLIPMLVIALQWSFGYSWLFGYVHIIIFLQWTYIKAFNLIHQWISKKFIYKHNNAFISLELLSFYILCN